MSRSENPPLNAYPFSGSKGRFTRTELFAQINFLFILFDLIHLNLSVALNFQTPGEMMNLNDGLFQLNGGSGYILKPDYLRNGKKAFHENIFFVNITNIL